MTMDMAIRIVWHFWQIIHFTHKIRYAYHVSHVISYEACEVKQSIDTFHMLTLVCEPTITSDHSALGCES